MEPPRPPRRDADFNDLDRYYSSLGNGFVRPARVEIDNLKSYPDGKKSGNFQKEDFVTLKDRGPYDRNVYEIIGKYMDYAYIVLAARNPRTEKPITRRELRRMQAKTRRGGAHKSMKNRRRLMKNRLTRRR
jgi:hypothetical protein